MTHPPESPRAQGSQRLWGGVVEDASAAQRMGFPPPGPWCGIPCHPPVPPVCRSGGVVPAPGMDAPTPGSRSVQSGTPASHLHGGSAQRPHYTALRIALQRPRSVGGGGGGESRHPSACSHRCPIPGGAEVCRPRLDPRRWSSRAFVSKGPKGGAIHDSHARWGVLRNGAASPTGPLSPGPLGLTPVIPHAPWRCEGARTRIRSKPAGRGGGGGWEVPPSVHREYTKQVMGQ